MSRAITLVTLQHTASHELLTAHVNHDTSCSWVSPQRQQVYDDDVLGQTEEPNEAVSHNMMADGSGSECMVVLCDQGDDFVSSRRFQDGNGFEIAFGMDDEQLNPLQHLVEEQRGVLEHRSLSKGLVGLRIRWDAESSLDT